MAVTATTTTPVTVATSADASYSHGSINLTLRDDRGRPIVVLPGTVEEIRTLIADLTAAETRATMWVDTAIDDAIVDAAIVNDLATAWAAGMMQP